MVRPHGGAFIQDTNEDLFLCEGTAELHKSGFGRQAETSRFYRRILPIQCACGLGFPRFLGWVPAGFGARLEASKARKQNNEKLCKNW
jgi:hypothetical protein